MPLQMKKWLVVAILFSSTLAFTVLPPVWAADGDLDPSFLATAGVSNISMIFGRFNYTDGTNRWLLYGDFTSMNGVAVNSLARFQADGNLDTSFTPPVVGEMRGVNVQPNGKLLIWGRIIVGSGNSTYYNLARLNSDGTVDPTFAQTLDQYGIVNWLGFQSDGKLLAGGWSLTVKGDTRDAYYLLRLNNNGTVDSTYPKFSAPGGLLQYNVVLNDDPANPNRLRLLGTIPNLVPGHTSYIVTLFNDGTVQDAVTDEFVDGPIFSYVTQGDGKVVFFGPFTQVRGVSRNWLARINTDGSLDTTFDPGTGFNGRARRIILQPDGKIVVAGAFTAYNSTPVDNIVRLTSTGAIDPSFQAAVDDMIYNLNPSGSGFFISGTFRTVNGSPRSGIAELDSNGALNTVYAGLTNDNTRKGRVYALALQADGKVLVGGEFTGLGGKYHRNLGRLHQDGSPDHAFVSTVDGYVRSLANQADGSILVGGYFDEINGLSHPSLGRLDVNGNLDRAFQPMITKPDNSVSELNRVISLNNGQILVAGDFGKIGGTDRNQMAFLNSNGSLDISFTSQITIVGGTGIIPRSVVQTADGKYVVAGLLTYQGLARGFLCRLLNGGSLDSTFGPAGAAPNPSPNVVITDGEVRDIALQSDGRIMIAGNFSGIIDGSGAPPLRGGIARFTATGVLDNTFTTDSGANNTVNCLAMQPDGKFLFGGYFNRYNQPDISKPENAGRIARILPNGDLDTSFISLPGADDALWAIALRPLGKQAVVGGQFTTYNGVSLPGLAQIITGAAFDSAALNLLLLE